MAGYYLKYNDRISGPYPIDVLKTMARDGLITTTHELSNDRERWLPVDQIPGLFDPPPASSAGGTPAPPTFSGKEELQELLANRGCGLAMVIGGVLLLLLTYAVAPNRLVMAFFMVVCCLILPGVYALVTGKEPEQ